MKKLIFITLIAFCFSFKPPIKNIQLIWDGNSISNYSNTNSLNGFYLPITTYNLLYSDGKKFASQYYPVSGKATYMLVNDFPTKIAPILRKNDVVVLWEITNDMHYDYTAQQGFNHLVDYANLVHSKGAKIVVVNYIARDYPGDAPDINTRGFGVNTLISQNPQHFDGIVDVGSKSIFDNAADCSDTNFYTDKLHLTARGRDTVAQSVKIILTDLLNN